MQELKEWEKPVHNFINTTLVTDQHLDSRHQQKNQLHIITKVMAVDEMPTFFQITVVIDQLTKLAILENDCLRIH